MLSTTSPSLCCGFYPCSGLCDSSFFSSSPAPNDHPAQALVVIGFWVTAVFLKANSCEFTAVMGELSLNTRAVGPSSLPVPGCHVTGGNKIIFVDFVMVMGASSRDLLCFGSLTFYLVFELGEHYLRSLA
jgi:hypothetical protein